MRKTRVYLATPYGHENMAVCVGRFEKVSTMAHRLMHEGYHVFSPISHSHPIAMLTNESHLDHAFWLDQDTAFLDWCDEVWVYCQPGWEESGGVDWEINWALEEGKPVKLINYETEEVKTYG